jgi:hypothetical protein
MIFFKSPLMGEAQGSDSKNRTSSDSSPHHESQTNASPSPGGEGRGEGELSPAEAQGSGQPVNGKGELNHRGRQSAPFVFQAYPSCGPFLPRLPKPAAAFSQAWPRLFRKFSKATQAHPRLSKVILEKKKIVYFL